MFYKARLSTEQLACLSALSTEQRLRADNDPRPARDSNVHLNLSSKLGRPLMELLARETLAKGGVGMIPKIFDITAAAVV